MATTEEQQATLTEVLADLPDVALVTLESLWHDVAEERLNAWLAWAQRSGLKPFVKLARTIRKHNAAGDGSSGTLTSNASREHHP